MVLKFITQGFSEMSEGGGGGGGGTGVGDGAEDDTDSCSSLSFAFLINSSCIFDLAINAI